MSSRAKEFFHWGYSGVFSPAFVGLWAAMTFGALALDSLDWLFYVAYAFLALGFIWGMGYWMTSDFLLKQRFGPTVQPFKRRYHAWKWGMGTAILIAFLLLAIITRNVQNARELSKSAGVLIPAGLPHPDSHNVWCNYQHTPPPVGSLVLYLGDSVFVVYHFPFTIIGIKDKSLLSMTKGADGELLISAEILSLDMKLVARVTSGRFMVNVHNIMSFRRDDRSSLVILDAYGREALNIKYINPSAVAVTGVFYMYPNVAPLVITDSSITTTGIFMGGNCTTNPQGDEALHFSPPVLR